MIELPLTTQKCWALIFINKSDGRVALKKGVWLTITGWWLTYPSEKYESQLGWLFPIYEKMKHVLNSKSPIR